MSSAYTPVAYLDTAILRDLRSDALLRERFDTQLLRRGLGLAISPVHLWELGRGKYEDWEAELDSLLQFSARRFLLPEPFELVGGWLQAQLDQRDTFAVTMQDINSAADVLSCYPEPPAHFDLWSALFALIVGTNRTRPTAYGEAFAVPELDWPASLPAYQPELGRQVFGAIFGQFKGSQKGLPSEVNAWVDDFGSSVESAMTEQRLSTTQARVALLKWSNEMLAGSMRELDALMLSGETLPNHIIKAGESTGQVLNRLPLAGTPLGIILGVREQQWRAQVGTNSRDADAIAEHLWPKLMDGSASDRRQKPEFSDFADTLHLAYARVVEFMTADKRAVRRLEQATRGTPAFRIATSTWPNGEFEALVEQMERSTQDRPQA